MDRSSGTALMIVDHPEGKAKEDRATSYSVRSYAIRVGLSRQRGRAKQKGENFREYLIHATVDKARPVRTAGIYTTRTEAPSGYLGLASADPFETLPINARRLTTLFHLRRCVYAGEPIISIDNAVRYQGLHPVFNTGLTDAALTPALGLIMSYAAKDWNFDHECERLSLNALQHVQERLSDCSMAISAALIGAVLFLLGVEYRLGARERAQAHLQGIKAMLNCCCEQNIPLPVPLRRAIYWQDLFCSIFVQTDRIVDVNFHPGREAPRLFLAPKRYVPEGFSSRASRLGDRFIHIAADVAALYRFRSDLLELNQHERGLQRVCNTQAYLEGQLHDLRQSTCDNLLISCTIATFLCMYAFWTQVWGSPLVPRVLSTQLLHHLRIWQSSENGANCDDDLSLWLVHIGRAFAIDGPVRQGFDEIQTREVHIDKPLSDAAARNVLNRFIWSEIFYDSEDRWFWQHIDEG